MKPRVAMTQEQPVGGLDLPGQPKNSPISPAVGFSPEGMHQEPTSELPSPFDQPAHPVSPLQPALPGLESIAARRARRGHEATAGIGKTALGVVGKATGLSSRPVKAARQTTRYGFDVAVGAGAEVTATTRARGSSRGRQVAALGATLKAGAGSILEDRSSRGVESASRRIVKNAGKLEARQARARSHSRAAVRAHAEGSLWAPASGMTKAVYHKAKAKSSEYWLGRAERKMANNVPKFERRSKAVSERISKAKAHEARGNRRREVEGLKPMSSVLDQKVVAEREARNTRVAERRKQAEAVIASRRR